ncbi:aldo/keto reductase [Paenibacillus sp. HB172176]|uniref:aldo/keto reductase n=1 Tax=Paenibacillus sp. HB172176 TaxID=2493690 RepID=UPI00143BED11|nr:aldo/keto reductase [Paenibacillus sp. HB172176]
MQYAYLGRSGLKVSRLCLGTMNFGVHTDQNEAFRILDAALDSGITFIDTADVYGGVSGTGASETIIGNWLAQGGNRRERAVLATKLYEPLGSTPYGPNDERGLSGFKIRRHLEASLKRLQTDHVELYQMHHVDRRTSWEELWGAFENIVHQGKADYIGSSNFAGWHLVKAQAAAKERKFLGLVSEQHAYNLMKRHAELEVLPAAMELGIGIVTWGPLAGGLLGGRSTTSDGGRRSGMSADRWERARPQLKQFESLCKQLGEKPAHVALAWLLDNPAVTSPVIGPRTAEQLVDTLRAVEIKLDDPIRKELDNIFPGLGGPAPEAYAW